MATVSTDFDEPTEDLSGRPLWKADLALTRLPQRAWATFA